MLVVNLWEGTRWRSWALESSAGSHAVISVEPGNPCVFFMDLINNMSIREKGLPEWLH